MNDFTIIFFAAACIVATPTMAADINAPIETRPTVGSEITRGTLAASDCSFRYRIDLRGLEKCISDALSTDQQKQPNFLPFEVGLFWGRCTAESQLIEAFTEIAATNPLAASKLPEVRESFRSSYGVFRNYQAKLGVTDQQLVDSDTQLVPSGKRFLLDILQKWERDYPQAGK
jgi:hypothetical protein